MPFADLALARRLEEANARWRAACAHAHAGVHPEAGVAVEPLAGGYAVHNPLGSPPRRACAYGIGLAGPVREGDLDRLEAFYRTRGVPPQIDLCPLADPSLVELLSRRGYRLEDWTNVLARDLPAGPPAAPPQADVEVRRAGLPEAELWAGVVARGFSGREEATPEELARSLALFRAPGMAFFLGLVGGRAAGGCAVFADHGVATLFAAGTVEEFRRRGVQSALLGACLASAEAAGCDLATALTDPGSGSQRNKERLGFRVAYTRALMACPRA